MSRYVATFHTHLSALLTARALQKAGAEVKMAPVPRKLSSSCGTCVFYTADGMQLECMDQDVEGIYQIVPGDLYERIYTGE